MRSRNVLAVLCVAALGVAATAAPATAVPRQFWGLVPQAGLGPEQLERLRTGGADSIRVAFDWGAVQPTRGGPFNWSGADALVANTSAKGLAVLPFLYGGPRWAVPMTRVPGGGGSTAPARLPVRGAAGAGWRQFVREAVRRYGPTGSFWVENPSVPRRPIRTWQIWNEPNFKYFLARPNPAEYGRLVMQTHAAARPVDRGVRLVLGGLFARPAEATRNFRPPRAFFATDFLRRMYRSTPGIRHRFEGVALHPYSARFQHLAPQIEEVREVLAQNRDRGKGMWITELGWSSKQPTRGNSFAKGRAGQARELRGAFKVLRRNQARWRLRQVYWFSVDDLPGSCNFCDGSGLFGPGFKPKPSWRAFVQFSGGRVR
jgi:hypothetical protein